MKFLVIKRLTTLALGAFLLTACATTPTQQGAVAGGLLGAGAGAIIGNQVGKQGEGALIGAAAGALAGALIGDDIDEAQTYGTTRPTYQRTVPPARTSAPSGHWETRTITPDGGETYEERVWVRDR